MVTEQQRKSEENLSSNSHENLINPINPNPIHRLQIRSKSELDLKDFSGKFNYFVRLMHVDYSPISELQIFMYEDSYI